MTEVLNPSVDPDITGTVERFETLYLAQGDQVSWNQHQPTKSTTRAIVELLDRSPRLHIACLGSGTGEKGREIVRFALRYSEHKGIAPDIKLIGFDAAPDAVEIANEKTFNEGLTPWVSFTCLNILDINPQDLEPVDMVHDYQAALTHIPQRYHQQVVRLENQLLTLGGKVLGNSFSKDTTNFYGVDISKLPSLEYTYLGMGCVFPTKKYIEDIYETNGFVAKVIQPVDHPSFPNERFHWDFLMEKVA